MRDRRIGRVAVRGIVLAGTMVCSCAGAQDVLPGETVDPEAPFRGLRWVQKSGDARGVFFQLRAHDAVLKVPGHRDAWRMDGAENESAGLLISCRIPGPSGPLGPDEGYTSGWLLAPDHPRQPDAWIWIDPRSWIAHLFGFDIEEWSVEVRGPDGIVETGMLERRRATYGQSRPELGVRFPPHAIVRWLAGHGAAERFQFAVTGPGVAWTLTFGSRPEQRPALERMVRFCPQVSVK